MIIPEPLNKDRICLGHRGGWWAEIETKGEIAHRSIPFLGDCAVLDMRELNVVLLSMADKSAPGVETVHAAIHDVLCIELSYVASPGSYDQKHIDRIGTLRNCIACGPSALELAHKPDEWIGIIDMRDNAKVMGRALETLLLPKP